MDKMLKICLEGPIDLIPEFLISMRYFMWLPMGAEIVRQFCLWLEAKWLSEEALQTAEERRKSKGKGEREIYTQLNADK